MAQSYNTDEGTLTIPGAAASWRVAQDNSGLSATGVVMLVGEAEAGPDFTLEADLAKNAFGPDQEAMVTAKYRGGPIVQAFRAAATPANDKKLEGAPSRIIIVKTNKSTRASAAMKLHDGSDYAFLADRSLGKLGNLIHYEVKEKTAEVVAGTGSFTWIPNVGALNAEIRVNGGSALALALAANRSPAGLVSAINSLSAGLASGGAARTVIPGVSGNLAVAVAGKQITITYSSTWTTIPGVGDTLVIPVGSAIAGASSENVGGYVVTAASESSIVAVKLSDAGKVGAVAGVITDPVLVNSVAVAATTDFTASAPVTVAVPGVPVPGLGKSLEIAQLTTGEDLLERCAFSLSAAAVAWVSKSGAPKLLVSAAEYAAKLEINRQLDNVQDVVTAGGEVALKIGYQGTTAEAVVDDTILTITVTGGAGASIGAISLKDFPTLADLAAYINSKTGYRCSVGNVALGQLPSTALDDGTFTCASSFGEMNGRIKIDGYRFYNRLLSEATLVRLQDSASASARVGQAAAGLPAPTTGPVYLSGGVKGPTLQEDVVAAVDALERVRGNFLVPLFSRNAAADITDGLTESGSTYDIDQINSYCRTHVLKLSTLKRQRNRQALLSKRGTFAEAKAAAANLANYRCLMAFMDVLVNGQQHQPWMGAVIAASMQAAGKYKGIVNKAANINGALQAAGDFNDQDDTQVEDALLAGLLPLRLDEDGSWRWVSDQTTYGKDSNFVLNSLQATYVADTVSLTAAKRFRAFVGDSTADVDAPLAAAFLEGFMKDMVQEKLVAPSDDAPLGFRKASIRKSGPALVVSAEVKVAGLIYFVPISFLMSQVQQSA